MRKLIAWPMFWLTYYGGHLAFLVCDSRLWPEDGCVDGSLCDRVFSVFYNAYQGGMRRSVYWNDWASLGQWSEPS